MNTQWMRRTRQLAAVYNLLWGSWVILRPDDLFRLTDIPLPRYPGIWQCVGMIVGVYGIGYAIAARDPLRHWPITLVGFLGKIFGPIGFLYGLWFLTPDDPGYLPPAWGLTIVTNDLIWWIPFAMILYAAVKAGCQPSGRGSVSPEVALQETIDQHGVPLMTHAERRPLLLLFLRHGGCTFCREALADIQKCRSELEREVGMAIVHLDVDDAAVAAQFSQYSLDDLPRVSDPDCKLYRSFGLARGSFSQLFGLSVWSRGAKACLVDKHGVGKLAGDGFQMPGLFLLKGSTILCSYRHRTAADRPDYRDFVRGGLGQAAE